MTAPLKAVDGTPDLPALMTRLGVEARAAARVLALASTAQKNDALAAMAKALRASASSILAANSEDVVEAKTNGSSSAFIDRLALSESRIAAMADGLDMVRGLPDPLGVEREWWEGLWSPDCRPSGVPL